MFFFLWCRGCCETKTSQASVTWHWILTDGKPATGGELFPFSTHNSRTVFSILEAHKCIFSDLKRQNFSLETRDYGTDLRWWGLNLFQTKQSPSVWLHRYPEEFAVTLVNTGSTGRFCSCLYWWLEDMDQLWLQGLKEKSTLKCFWHSFTTHYGSN